MSTTTPEVSPKPAIPRFPCPHCGADMLAEGFYNSCSETQRLREDNYPLVVGNTLYLVHDENNLETIAHECDVEAYCTSCGNLLPWTLYELRGELDDIDISNADTAIAKLIALRGGEPESANR